MRKEQLTHTFLLFIIAIGILGYIHFQPDTAQAQENAQTYPECWVQIEDTPLYFVGEQLPTGINLELLADTYRFASEYISPNIDELPGLPAVIIFANKIADVQQFFPQLQNHDVSDAETRGWRAVVALNPDNKCEITAITPNTPDDLIRDGVVVLNVSNTAPPDATFEEQIVMYNASTIHEALHTLGTEDDNSMDIRGADYWDLIFLAGVLNLCQNVSEDPQDQNFCTLFREQVLIPNDFAIGRSD